MGDILDFRPKDPIPQPGAMETLASFDKGFLILWYNPQLEKRFSIRLKYNDGRIQDTNYLVTTTIITDKIGCIAFLVNDHFAILPTNRMKNGQAVLDAIKYENLSKRKDT